MRTKEQILETIRRELPNLKRSYPISRLALFGSYSRNEQTRDSDVDLLIDFDGPIGLFKIIELEGLLSDLLGVKVDLVTTSSLKELLRPQVLKEAIYA